MKKKNNVCSGSNFHGSQLSTLSTKLTVILRSSTLNGAPWATTGVPTNPVVRKNFVFFFSSRRRHTSWPRDWSSDVSSSDLNWSFDEMLTLAKGLTKSEGGRTTG